MSRLASSRVAWRKTCLLPPPGRWTQGPNNISDCQIWLANWASYFLCAVAEASSSWREGRQAGLVVLAGEREFAQQGGAGAVRVLAFEPFDEGGGFRRHRARLPA